MKNYFYLPLVILFFLSSFTSSAQSKSKAKSISSKGYWVVESNIKTPKTNSIYFYNNENTMVYHEKVDGIKLNINRRKTLLKLKSVLDQAVMAWERGERENTSGALIAVAFKN